MHGSQASAKPGPGVAQGRAKRSRAGAGHSILRGSSDSPVVAQLRQRPRQKSSRRLRSFASEATAAATARAGAGAAASPGPCSGEYFAWSARLRCRSFASRREASFAISARSAALTGSGPWRDSRPGSAPCQPGTPPRAPYATFCRARASLTARRASFPTLIRATLPNDAGIERCASGPGRPCAPLVEGGSGGSCATIGEAAATKRARWAAETASRA
jgi:hypothetical protein